MIIERGITLFTNLLAGDSPSTYDKEIKYKLSVDVFNLVLKYSESNSSNIFHSCVYSISLALDNDIRLADLIDNSNLLNDITNKKFFSNDKIILYCNRIIGEYVAYKSGLPDEFYIKCTKYELDIFFGAKSYMTVYEVLWVLSNIIHDSVSSAELVCNNDPFIDKLLLSFTQAIKFEEIRDISYLLNTLIKLINVNSFIKLFNKGFVDVTLQRAKNTFDEPKKIIVVFELIESYLDIGKMIEEKFGKNNFVKEKCEQYELKSLLEKYENCDDESLDRIVNRILRHHFSNL